MNAQQWITTYNDVRILSFLKSFPDRKELENNIQIDRLVDKYNLDLTQYREKNFYSVETLNRITELYDEKKTQLLQKYEADKIMLMDDDSEIDTRKYSDPHLHLHIREEETALLYTFIRDMEVYLKYPQMPKVWNQSWIRLFRSDDDDYVGDSNFSDYYDLSYVHDALSAVFESNEPLYEFDKFMIQSLLRDFEPAVKLVLTSSIHLAKYKAQVTDPRSVYYVNEMNRLRLDADLYVCDYLIKMFDRFIEENRENTVFTRDIQQIIRKHHRARQDFDYREMEDDDSPTLFTTIANGIQDANRINKTKYYVVALVASNLMSETEWSFVQEKVINPNFAVSKRISMLYNDIFGDAHISDPVAREVRKLSFDSDDLFYSVDPKEYRALIISRDYINRIIKYMFGTLQFRTYIEDKFSDESIFGYYMEFYKSKTKEQKVVRYMEKRLYGKMKRRELLQQMAQTLLDNVDDITDIEEEESQEIIMEHYEFANSALDDILDYVASVVVFLGECSNCTEPAIGRCCDVRAYCSTKCQAAQWDRHKLYAH